MNSIIFHAIHGRFVMLQIIGRCRPLRSEEQAQVRALQMMLARFGGKETAT